MPSCTKPHNVYYPKENAYWIQDRSPRFYWNRTMKTSDWVPGLLACGTCACCKLNKKREIGLRLFHETQTQKDAVFMTLTYRDECLPEEPTLRDWQLCAKRMRQDGLKFRYFVCVERGDLTNRIHMHAVITGIDFMPGSYLKAHDKFISPIMEQRYWKLGHVEFSPVVTINRAMYTAGYVLKKAPDKTGHGDIGSLKKRPNNTTSHSIRLGETWVKTHYRDILQAGYIPMGNSGYAVPKAYFTYVDGALDAIKEKNRNYAITSLPTNTTEYEEFDQKNRSRNLNTIRKIEIGKKAKSINRAR